MDANKNTDMKSKRLGRGLSALVTNDHRVEVPTVSPQDSRPSTPSKTNVGGEEFTSIALDQIHPNKFQPRRGFDLPALQLLAQSIKTSGVIQPIVVRHDPASGRYELVAGERRWRAARIAGLTSIPALVRVISDELAAEWALVENVQREDLNPMDRAWGLRSLIEKFGLVQNEVAEKVGLDRSTVANLIRLTELEPEIAEMIAKNELSAGHGKALLQAPAGQSRVGLARVAAKEEWSVRRLELASRTAASGTATESGSGGGEHPRRAVHRDLERQISQYLGTKVEIATDRTGKKGTLSIEFYGLDHFEGLLARLGIPARA